MRKIAVYKSGDHLFDVEIPNDRQMVKSMAFPVCGMPFEARDRLTDYALGQTNTVTYREWRWAWQKETPDVSSNN